LLIGLRSIASFLTPAVPRHKEATHPPHPPLPLFSLFFVAYVLIQGLGKRTDIRTELTCLGKPDEEKGVGKMRKQRAMQRGGRAALRAFFLRVVPQLVQSLFTLRNTVHRCRNCFLS